MPSALQQVLSIPEVQELLSSFAELTGTRVCLFKSNHFEPIGEGREISHFCQLIKSVPTGHAKCLESDKKAMETVSAPDFAEPGSFYRYHCHMGLWECVVPVKGDGEAPMGYLMLGQVAPQEFSEKEWERIKAEIETWPCKDQLDLVELYSARQALITLSSRRFDAACKFLSVLANFLVSAKLIESILPSRVEMIRDLIEREGAITLEELGEALDLNPAYVSAFYKQATGETITDYTLRKRLERAEKMLRESDLTILEIALELGFSDQSYFSRCFKKQFHLPPGKYRNLYQEKTKTDKFRG